MKVQNTPAALRRSSARWLTTTALLMGMNIVLSLSIFSIPVPGGHLYFCDAVIDTAAILLDPLAAFVVGGVGSFLGDFFFYPDAWAAGHRRFCDLTQPFEQKACAVIHHRGHRGGGHHGHRVHTGQSVHLFNA